MKGLKGHKKKKKLKYKTHRFNNINYYYNYINEKLLEDESLYIRLIRQKEKLSFKGYVRFYVNV